MNFNLNQDVVEELQKRSVFQRSFWSSSTTWRRGPVHLSGTRNDAQTESLDRRETLRNRDGSDQKQGTDRGDCPKTSSVGRNHSHWRRSSDSRPSRSVFSKSCRRCEAQLERGGGGSHGRRIESRTGDAVVGHVSKLVLSAGSRHGRLSAEAASARVHPTSRSTESGGAEAAGSGPPQSACLRRGLATHLGRTAGYESHELLSCVEERRLDSAWPPSGGIARNSRPPPTNAGSPERL